MVRTWSSKCFTIKRFMLYCKITIIIKMPRWFACSASRGFTSNTHIFSRIHRIRTAACHFSWKILITSIQFSLISNIMLNPPALALCLRHREGQFMSYMTRGRSSRPFFSIRSCWATTASLSWMIIYLLVTDEAMGGHVRFQVWSETSTGLSDRIRALSKQTPLLRDRNRSAQVHA